jgi:septum site-determining protein MinC
VASLPAPSGPQDQLVFKGFKHGLRLILPKDGTFEDIIGELKDRLEKARDFFRGANLIVETKGRSFSWEERSRMEDLLNKHGVSMMLDTDNEKEPLENNSEKNAVSQVPTMMVKRTLRSGQRVEFNGNVVVKGDVNPGAEVVASGDIVILGALRGIAHAGAGGDTKAEVVAFSFHPVQLRIASYISRSPEKQIRSSHPEVARVKEETIVVESYDSRIQQ